MWNQKQRHKRSTHLYVGSGFPRASQCIITFFSSESNGKITSSGSSMNTGPNSSLSVKMNKKRGKQKEMTIIARFTPGVPISFTVQLPHNYEQKGKMYNTMLWLNWKQLNGIRMQAAYVFQTIRKTQGNKPEKSPNER